MADGGNLAANFEHILLRDATSQLQALAAGEVSACELLEAALARRSRLDPKINAVVSCDAESAFVAAQKIDDLRARGEPVGRLAGLPMTVKDTLDVEGLPASAGIKMFLDRRGSDAEVIAKIRENGAVIWGKTNVPVKAGDWQTYNALYGTTNNPWDLTKTPGGSSGGSAAALAAGFTALEIGADIAGSLRLPASFCGVYAHKPSYGIVSQRGLLPPLGRCADLDLAVVGPMARSARDLRLLLSVIARVPIEEETTPQSMRGVRLALSIDEPDFAADPQVQSVIVAFVRRLEEAGAIVEPIGCPVDAKTLMFTYMTLLLSLTGADATPEQRFLYELCRFPAKIARVFGAGPLSWAHGVWSSTARHSDWLEANEARALMRVSLSPFFQRYDALLSPIAPVPAFPHDHSPLPFRRLKLSTGRKVKYLELANWNALASLCGLPATAMPAGLTSEGLPVGIQIMGPERGDGRILRIAEAIDEQVGFEWRQPSLQ